MAHLAALMLLVLVRFKPSCASEEYIGPASSEYFRESFSESNHSLARAVISCRDTVNGTTNSSRQVVYYTLNISSTVAASSLAQLTTCSEVEDALDTIIYILYEKKGQLNLLDTFDADGTDASVVSELGSAERASLCVYGNNYKTISVTREVAHQVESLNCVVVLGVECSGPLAVPFGEILTGRKT